MKQKLLFGLIVMFFVIGNINAQKIAFLQNRSSTFRAHQDGIVQELRNAGYEVTIVDLGLRPIDFAFLNTQDLVILSRTINSADVIEPATAPDDDWAKLTVPYLNLSVWSIRNNRLKLVNSSVIGQLDDKTDLTSITKAKPVVADPIFMGVTYGTDAFGCYKGYYEYFDDVMTGNSGIVMAVLNDDAVEGAGRPIMIRWAAGQATYTGGVTNIAPRTYLCIGTDDSPQNPNPNYSNYTAQSLRLFMNEVSYLIALKAPAKNDKTIAYVENRSSTYVEYQDPIIEYLSNAGYTVDKISIVGLDPSTLSAYDLVIIGRNTFSADFTVAKQQAWATLSKPYIMLSAYGARAAGRLALVGATAVSNINKDSLGLDKLTKVMRVVSDPVFNGVTNTSPSAQFNYTGKTFDYYTGEYDYLDYMPAQFTDEGNSGKIMAVLNTNAYAGAGRPVFVRWEAGKETFTGSGVTNAAARTYLQIGSDNGPALPNYNNFTTGSLRLLRNEILHLISPENEAAPNFVINGHFEQGPGAVTWLEDNGKDSVKAVYTATVNTVDPISGKSDLAIDFITAGMNAGRPFFLFYTSDTIFKGKDYTFSFKTKVVSGTPAIYSFTYGIGLKNFNGTLEGTQDWSFDYKATANMVYVILYFNGTQTGKIEIDDIKIVEKLNTASIDVAESGMDVNAFPNPFKSSVNIQYVLKKQSPVSLSVYDLSGRIVKTLINRKESAGMYSVVWNGTDYSGKPLSNGMYFYKLVAGDYIKSGKLILQK